MNWLSKVCYHSRSVDIPTKNEQQPAWGRSREFDITTRSVNRNSVTKSTTGDLEVDEEDDDGLVHGRQKRLIQFMPSLG